MSTTVLNMSISTKSASESKPEKSPAKSVSTSGSSNIAKFDVVGVLILLFFLFLTIFTHPSIVTSMVEMLITSSSLSNLNDNSDSSSLQPEHFSTPSSSNTNFEGSNTINNNIAFNYKPLSPAAPVMTNDSELVHWGHVWYFGWITAVCTGLGALPFFFIKEPNKLWIGISNGRLPISYQ